MTGPDSDTRLGERPAAGALATPDGHIAWAFWTKWHGPPELVAHVIRSAQFAVADQTGGNTGTCAVELHVGDDVETFATPKEFTELATSDGLRRLSRLHVAVSGPHSVVDVEWTAPPRSLLSANADIPAPALLLGVIGLPVALYMHLRAAWSEPLSKRGVSLAVQAASQSAAIEQRNHVAASIARCTGRTRQHQGVATDLAAIEQELSDIFRGTRDWSRIIVLLLLLFTAAIATLGYVVWLIDDVVFEPSSTDQSVFAEFVRGRSLLPDLPLPFVAVAAAVGLGMAGVARWLWVPVDVSAMNRRQRALSVTYKGVLAAAISAFIANGVRLLLGA
jgi:hypothetical protein